MNAMHGLWPGVVDSYNATKRTCRVRIPGVTDGSDTLPEAVFSNPLGDRADLTEIRILAGDPVWLMFECGDARFPIITGYRTPREGNPTEWRRWAHANIELTADGTMILNATTLQINAQQVQVSADGVQVAANMHVTGADLTHNGTNVGDTHTHSGILPGPASTGTPN